MNPLRRKEKGEGERKRRGREGGRKSKPEDGSVVKWCSLD